MVKKKSTGTSERRTLTSSNTGAAWRPNSGNERRGRRDSTMKYQQHLDMEHARGCRKYVGNARRRQILTIHLGAHGGENRSKTHATHEQEWRTRNVSELVEGRHCEGRGNLAANVGQKTRHAKSATRGDIKQKQVKCEVHHAQDRDSSGTARANTKGACQQTPSNSHQTECTQQRRNVLRRSSARHWKRKLVVPEGPSWPGHHLGGIGKVGSDTQKNMARNKEMEQRLGEPYCNVVGGSRRSAASRHPEHAVRHYVQSRRRQRRHQELGATTTCGTTWRKKQKKIRERPNRKKHESMMVLDRLQGEGDSWYNFIQRGMSAEVRTAVKENSLATSLRGSKERDRSAEQRNGECHGDSTEMAAWTARGTGTNVNRADAQDQNIEETVSRRDYGADRAIHIVAQETPQKARRSIQSDDGNSCAQNRRRRADQQTASKEASARCQRTQGTTIRHRESLRTITLLIRGAQSCTSTENECTSNKSRGKPVSNAQNLCAVSESSNEQKPCQQNKKHTADAAIHTAGRSAQPCLRSATWHGGAQTAKETHTRNKKHEK